MTDESVTPNPNPTPSRSIYRHVSSPQQDYCLGAPLPSKDLISGKLNGCIFTLTSTGNFHQFVWEIPG